MRSKSNVKLNKLAKEIIEQNPAVTENRRLAKILYAKYPLLFNDIEAARSIIRYTLGKKGDKAREWIDTSFIDRLAKLRIKHQVEEGKPADVTPYKFPKGIRKLLVISDLHVPYHDMRALDIALKYGYEQKVDGVLINGDLLDFNTVSRFLSRPNEMRMLDNIEMGKTIIRYIKDALGVKMVFHEGNHDCYDDKTEVLTDSGFKLFSELKHTDSVAQFDDKRNISFAIPKKYIKKKYDGIVYDIENNYSKQCVTANHDVVIGDEKKKASDLVLDDLKQLPLNGFSNNEDYEISDNLLRLLVWVVMDATIVDGKKTNQNHNKKRIQFKLSKPRKIEKLQALLNEMSITYTIKPATMCGMNVLQPFMIRIYSDFAQSIFDYLGGEKKLPKYFTKLSKRQSQIVIDTICETDGTWREGAVKWSSTSKSDVDVIHEMCIVNGVSVNVKEKPNASGFVNGKLQYEARIHNNNNESLNVKKINERIYFGMVYCVEMPLGTVVTRRDGKIAFSGNCRAEHYLMRQAPEFWGLESIELKNLLQCPELNIDYVNNIKTMHYGKLTIAHGNHIVKGVFAPVNPARGAFVRSNASVMISHCHRSSTHIETDIKGKVTGAWSIGCICTISPEYNPMVSKHNMGFAVVELISNQGDFIVDNRMILDYQVR